MNKSIWTGQTLSLLTAVMAAMMICWVTGCAKKSGRETVPEIPDTLSVTSDTLSKTHDTLSETSDTLSKILGTFTDKRDGKMYKTVNMPDGKIWMAQNLNYKTPDSSWCYENSVNNCTKYGRLYAWNATKKVCPAGWHLPSGEEWENLIAAVGDEETYEKLHADMRDVYGFSAIGSGSRTIIGDSARFLSIGRNLGWWAATEAEYGGSYGYGKCLVCGGGSTLMYQDNENKGNGHSVRCVCDKSAAGALSQKGVGNDSIVIEMVFVKGGTFMMGCTSEQGSDCADNEKPAHSVTVGDFYIGKYEVTQNQWVQVNGGDNKPSYFKGGNLPVERVSWDNIQRFILRLNSVTGEKYRLPTEAEWEYAARGGASGKGYKYSGSNSANDVAWYDVNSGDRVLRDDFLEKYVEQNEFDAYDTVLSSNKNRTRAVGTKAPNELGIYDMSGNVWEWVNDSYGNYDSTAQINPSRPSSGPSPIPVFRGGGWGSGAVNCRVSSRDYIYPFYRKYNMGFRLALSP